MTCPFSSSKYAVVTAAVFTASVSVSEPVPVTLYGSGAEGYQGVIAGHEPCGQIVSVGPGVSGFQPGDRVAIYHIKGCGLCEHCIKGWMINCRAELTYVDGALAACGFGTAFAACERAQVSGRDRVLITGLGPVGLGVALLSRALGVLDINGVDSIPQRRTHANSLSCFTRVLDTTDTLTLHNNVEVAFECSGAPQARVLCLHAAREWGRVVFIGEGGSVSFEPSPLLLHKQLTLLGSWVCSVPQMRELLGLLERWDLHPECIVTHRFGLDQIRQAYEVFDTQTTGKVVIVND
eukprot:jgi/Chlat1/3486/Chrsp23S03686